MIIKQPLKTGRIVMTAVMVCVALLYLFPFLYMLSSSFKVEIDIFRYPMEWLPSRTSPNYARVWLGSYNYINYFKNSVVVTTLTVLGTLFTSSLAAYGFTKLQFKGRDVLFLLYLATMIIPNTVTIVPRFILYQQMDIYDTHLALILPGIFSAFGVFMLRQAMVTVPMELNEAARIDGANELYIWSRIVMPLTLPAMVSLMLLTSVQTWNDYINPLIFLKHERLYTLPLGLINFIDDTGKQYSLIMAASVSAVLPPILLFLFGQKFFISGLMSGAVKG